MAARDDRQCPSCGKTVPSEEGQHAENLITAQVKCPHCGATVTLAPDAGGEPHGDAERAGGAPPGRQEGIDAFAGEETMDDVADELRDKPS